MDSVTPVPLISRNWFVKLHEKFQHDFNLFQNIYNNKEKFRFGINYSGELGLWDAAYLYLLIRERQPENVLIIGGGNGFTESLVAAANYGNYSITSYEKHPGPRTAANERADYFGYRKNLKQLVNLKSDNLFDFIIIMENIKKFPVLRYLKDKCILYFNGDHFKTDKPCGHIKDYIMPEPESHRDVLLGSWWDLLNYWDYEQFGEQLFTEPHSTALFIG